MGASCSRILGETGAPAEITRFKVGKRSERALPACASRRKRAGEPNMFVTPKSSMASKIFVGLTRAGCVGSMSGTIAVMPRAGANRANSGNVQRSISPGSIA